MNKLNGLLKYFLLLPFGNRASNATSVVLRLGSTGLMGSAKQFSGTAKHIPKKKSKRRSWRKKNFVWKRFSGNLSFQTKLNKHNLLWNLTGYIHIYDMGPSITDVRTKSRKIDPLPPCPANCSHWLNLPSPLSVRTHQKFRKIRSFLCQKVRSFMGP